MKLNQPYCLTTIVLASVILLGHTPPDDVLKPAQQKEPSGAKSTSTGKVTAGGCLYKPGNILFSMACIVKE